MLNMLIKKLGNKDKKFLTKTGVSPEDIKRVEKIIEIMVRLRTALQTLDNEQDKLSVTGMTLADIGFEQYLKAKTKTDKQNTFEAFTNTCAGVLVSFGLGDPRNTAELCAIITRKALTSLGQKTEIHFNEVGIDPETGEQMVVQPTKPPNRGMFT